MRKCGDAGLIHYQYMFVCGITAETPIDIENVFNFIHASGTSVEKRKKMKNCPRSTRCENAVTLG
ncbi:MAG: hypothetical protein EZS28_048123, partial [Streblomastix strix]